VSKITTEPTSQDLNYWATRPYLRQETQERVRKAEVVLVPREGFRDQEIRSFPVRTEEFHRFLKDALHDRHSVDVAIEDKEYKELALHSALIELGALVVAGFVAPLIVNIISDYINRRAEAAAKKEDAKVRFELTIVEQDKDSVRAVKIAYDGPATDFLPAMQKALAETPRVAVLPPPALPAPKPEDK
jgi:hypothetical protein